MSAAQNGELLQTCHQCGAVNDERAESCCFCDAHLGSSEAADANSAKPEVRPTHGNLAVDPQVNPQRDLQSHDQADWRNEVSSRLEAFRARRRGIRAPDGQTALPFGSESPAGMASLAAREGSALVDSGEPLSPARSVRPRIERLEIAIAHPVLGPPAVERGPSTSGAQPLQPVASLPERRRAAALDLALLLFTFGAILALFFSLGGHFTFTRLDAAVTLAVFALFYAQYMTLFTVFGGATPGMMLRGLRVVSFDGSDPTPGQLAWRSFGYFVSAGTFGLGFLWSLWDEDHLCWQDRISQTYLTLVDNPLADHAKHSSSG